MPGLEQQHTFLIVGLYTTCNAPPPHTTQGGTENLQGQGRLWGWGVDCSGGPISMPWDLSSGQASATGVTCIKAKGTWRGLSPLRLTLGQRFDRGMFPTDPGSTQLGNHQPGTQNS